MQLRDPEAINRVSALTYEEVVLLYTGLQRAPTGLEVGRVAYDIGIPDLVLRAG